jgi:hypothetical protein
MENLNYPKTLLKLNLRLKNKLLKKKKKDLRNLPKMLKKELQLKKKN